MKLKFFLDLKKYLYNSLYLESKTIEAFTNGIKLLFLIQIENSS